MKKINIPIHKHTPKRYRRSKWVVYMSWFSTDEPADPIYENGSIYPTHPLVTDLQRVPKAISDRPPRKIKMHFTPLPWTELGKPKKLAIFKNLWQNKIKKIIRRK